jgi:hypothetical protein
MNVEGGFNVESLITSSEIIATDLSVDGITQFGGIVDFAQSLNVQGGVNIEGSLNLESELTIGDNIVKGSRKIAKSPFHLPTPRGQYAVDLHNITTWIQTESGVAIRKSFVASILNTVYESFHAPATLVSDVVPTIGGGRYEPQTKYGVKNVSGSYFYDASKQAFMTPPTPISLSIFMPSTRDKNQEFNYYETNSPVNYYPLEYSGCIEYEIGYNGGSAFYNDIASDSVYQLIKNYDFSQFTTDDLPKNLNNNIIYPTLLADIASSKLTAGDSNVLRYTFIRNVFRLFIGVVTLSTRSRNLLNAIKATGGFQRQMSYKWNVKRYSEYTDTSGVLSTNISLTQKPAGQLPVFICQDMPEYLMSDLASRGIIAIRYHFDYDTSYIRLPNSNTLPIFEGALLWSSNTSKIQNDTKFYTFNDYLTFSYNQTNLYNIESGHALTEGYFTGADSVIYIKEFLRELYNQFVQIGLTNYIDITKVAVEGVSGNGMLCSVANIINETDINFPIKFKCCVSIDTLTGLPWNNGEGVGDYFGNETQRLLPNGFSIPVLWMDLNHGSYDPSSQNYYVGYIPELQRQFRKTPTSIRGECFYHEMGNTHNPQGAIDERTNGSLRTYVPFLIYIHSTGIDYPNDLNNNPAFNERYISLESDFVMSFIKSFTGISLFVSKWLLTDSPYTNTMIKDILPGKTVISPYTLDDAGDFLTNAVVQESIKLSKTVKTFEDSEYDFKYKLPNNFSTFIDTVDLFSINKEFTLSSVPEGYLQELIVTGHNLLYDSSAHLVPNASGFNFTTSYDFDSSVNVIPITFIPSTDSATWNIQDVSGVKWFVSGTMEPVQNVDPNNSSAGESQAPFHSNSVTMKIKLPLNCTSGQISFDYKVSSEIDWDFVKIYKNTTLLEKVSGADNTDIMSGLISFTSPTITQSDEIIVIYDKDSGYTMGFDVAFVNNIVVNGADPSNIPLVPVPAGTIPKITVKLGNTILVDNQSIDIINQQLFTHVYIDKTLIQPLKIFYTENICTSGYVSIYMKLLPLPSVNGKAILDI